MIQQQTSVFVCGQAPGLCHPPAFTNPEEKLVRCTHCGFVYDAIKRVHVARADGSGKCYSRGTEHV